MYQFLIQLISALVALRFTLPSFSSPPRCSAFLQNHELSRHERCRDCLANRTRTKDSSRVPWPKTAGRFAGSPRAPQANARGRDPLAPKCSPPDGNPTRRTRIPGLPPRPRASLTLHGCRLKRLSPTNAKCWSRSEETMRWQTNSTRLWMRHGDIPVASRRGR